MSARRTQAAPIGDTARQDPSPQPAGSTGAAARAELFGLADGLLPEVHRARTLARLDGRFRAGTVPDPWPDGFLRGRLLTTSIWRPFDAFVRRLARLWMPWQGKSFDAAASTGVNRFLPSAAGPMRLLWPRYRPETREPDRMEAFPFRNRVEPGALDPGLLVLKIDYDFEANPDLLIRRILDELVQVGDGLYLGKVLFRWGSGYRSIGFFSLEG